MWLIFLIVWLGIMVIFAVKKPNNFMNPVFWMTFGWIFITGLYFTCGYEYSYKLKKDAFIYFLLNLVLFAIGFEFSKKYKFILKKDRRHQSDNKMMAIDCDFLYNLNHKALFWICVLGTAIFVVDFFRLNSFSVSMDVHTGSIISFIGVLGKIAAFLGIVIWLYECAYAIPKNLKIHPTAVISAICYVIPGVFTSGRQSILLLIVSTVTVFLRGICVNKKYKYLNRTVTCGVAVFILLMFYVTVVSGERQVTSNKIALFEYIFQCKISDETINLFNRTGSLKTFFLEIVSYYSHELSMLQLIFDNWKDIPHFGMSQFQLISLNLPEDSFFSYYDISSKVQMIYDQYGMYSHTWRTVAANNLIDFGKIGGLIYMWFCGYIVGRIYMSVINRMNTMDLVLIGLLNAGTFFCIQYSPFCEVSWYYPMIWILVGIPVINYCVGYRFRQKRDII